MVRKVVNNNSNKKLSFLYNTKIGRIILKPLVSNKFISSVIGFILSKKISCIAIKPFIKHNNIDMDYYEEKKYNSFNDFFTRKMKKEKIKIANDKNDFIAPCDSKLMVYNIDDNSIFNIKNTLYTVNSLVKNKNIAKEFTGGYALVFRLSPEDYHRYYFIDDGYVLKKYKINGYFHSVNPIVYDKYEVFKENARECTLLKTNNFEKLLYVEVGALLVGKINNYNIKKFNKGDEKGYFMFGGSTVIILVKKDIIKVDSKILKNSKLGYESYVKFGEKIAKRL